MCDVREKPQLVNSHVPPTRDLARNPGMCPDWQSNWRSFCSQASAQFTEPHQPGLYGFCVNLSFHSSRINAQEFNCWVIGQLHVQFFKETMKLFSQVTVPFYIPTNGVYCFFGIWWCQWFLFLSDTLLWFQCAFFYRAMMVNTFTGLFVICVFSGEMCLHVFCACFNWIVCVCVCFHH